MWFVFALLSAVFAALTSILAKVGIEGVNSNLATAIRTVVVLAMAWGMVLVTNTQGGLADISRKSWLFLILSGLATGASWLCYYRALQIGEASKVVPIDKLSVVITLVLAFVFLHERFTPKSLIGCLLVGVSAAKALAYALGVPLIKVNHIQGHIAANFIAFDKLEPPFLALVASGGHTSIIRVENYNTFVPVSATMDDAIGEAFDKVARVLGLPYPGGPEIDKRAKLGNANIKFCPNLHARADLAYSFSGLKTAVVNYVHNLRQRGEELQINDICASFTAEAIGYTVDTFIKCATEYGLKQAVLAGGVAANSALRARLTEQCENCGIKLFVPPPVLCTDNAAMIAARGYYSFIEGKDIAGLDLNAVSNL